MIHVAEVSIQIPPHEWVGEERLVIESLRTLKQLRPNLVESISRFNPADAVEIKTPSGSILNGSEPALIMVDSASQALFALRTEKTSGEWDALFPEAANESWGDGDAAFLKTVGGYIGFSPGTLYLPTGADRVAYDMATLLMFTLSAHLNNRIFYL